MKSSTPSNINLQTFGAQRRLEEQLKREIKEYEHLISSHTKEMQALRDDLRIAMERFESLYQKNDTDLKDFKTYSTSTMGSLNAKIGLQETAISDQKSSIYGLHDQLMAFEARYCSREEVSKVRKILEEQMKDATMGYLMSFQSFQREIKDWINAIRDDLSKLINETDQKFDQVKTVAENNLSVSRIDREGVLKQVRIYEKSMFIIEKKIENLYTLIERINNRGGLTCHKPD